MNKLPLILITFFFWVGCNETPPAVNSATEGDEAPPSKNSATQKKQKFDEDRVEEEKDRKKVEIKFRIFHNWHNAFDLEDVLVDGVKFGTLKKWDQTPYKVIHSQNPDIEFTDTRDGKRIKGKLLGDPPVQIMENNSKYTWRTDTNWIERQAEKKTP